MMVVAVRYVDCAGVGVGFDFGVELDYGSRN
jgi:hypothetical protein